MSNSNKSLQSSKDNKSDEFYTQYKDIEEEVSKYKDQLKDKIIYCNCDDPDFSNFVKYFKDNFERFKLKALYASGYIDRQLNLFSDKGTVDPKYIKYYGKDKCETIYDSDNGSYSSHMSIKLLKECDIVITNPPFSLARDFLKILFYYNKKFLFIGTLHMSTYKPFLDNLKKNDLRAGHRLSSNSMYFLKNLSQLKNNYYIKDEDIENLTNIGFIVWWTNLKVNNRKCRDFVKIMYNEKNHKKCDIYGAININKMSEFCDVEGEVLAVPITIFDYDLSNYIILGNMSPKINGISKYNRILIKKIKT